MMAGTSSARRSAVRALAVLAFAAAAAAQAQDPKAVAVQKDARAWLALTDSIDAGASWEAAGAKFKGAITAETWDVSLRQARVPLGAVVQRAMIETTFDQALPAGGPEGDFALIKFRTAFANKLEALETVTLEREADSAWRVIGYYIR